MRSSGRASRSPRSASNTFSIAPPGFRFRKRLHGLLDLPGPFGPHARAQFIEVGLDLLGASQARFARRQRLPELRGQEGQRQRHVFALARQRVQNFERTFAIAPAQCGDQRENGGRLRIGDQRRDIVGGDLARRAGITAAAFRFRWRCARRRRPWLRAAARVPPGRVGFPLPWPDSAPGCAPLPASKDGTRPWLESRRIELLHALDLGLVLAVEFVARAIEHQRTSGVGSRR